MIGTGWVDEINIPEFDLSTNRVFVGGRIILFDGRDAINNLVGSLTCSFGEGYGLEGWACTSQSEKTDEDSEEDSHGVTGSVLSALSVVPEACINPGATHSEGVGIAEIDAEEEETEGETGADTLLFSCLFNSSQKCGVVSHLELLSAEGDDDTDCSQSLFSIACSLTVRTASDYGIFLHNVSENTHSTAKDWSDSEHGQSK